MTKKQKEEYIEKINDRFINSRNHGHNGSNWWYPKENTIAYNVKMYHSGISVEDIRKKLTARQNEFYKNDEFFYELTQQQIEQSAESLIEEVEAEKGVKTTGFAGRSGGWFEVEYINSIGDYEELNDRYTEAKELEALEVKIESIISERKASLEKYLESEEFLKDTLEQLNSDNDIADIYKGRAKDLLDKLK